MSSVTTNTMTYREAVRAAIREAMTGDERVFLMGEDVGRYGGSFGVSKGLLDEFGADRIRDAPLSESAFVGAGIGAAMSGYTIASFYYDAKDVVIAGDTGVVHARYSQIASYDGRDLSSMFRLTDVWTRRDGSWQVVARHSSILS